MIKILSISTRGIRKVTRYDSRKAISHAPNSNNDNVQRKLEETQNQLFELRSIQTEKEGDADLSHY